MNIFKKIRASLRLREAIRQAETAHQQNGERYYVLPADSRKGSLIIMDRKNFRTFKHKGYIKGSIFIRDLEHECFYATPYRNGSGELTPFILQLKKKQYYSWLDAAAKSRRNGKLRKH